MLLIRKRLCQNYSVLTTLFFLLCFTGFLISAYFTAIYLQISVPLLNKTARWCRVDADQCGRVIELPASHLFRYPNFVLGLIYYLVMMLSSIFSFPFQWVLILAAWAVTGFSAYLAYQLYAILKTPCPLCYISHVLNFCIAILISFI